MMIIKTKEGRYYTSCESEGCENLVPIRADYAKNILASKDAEKEYRDYACISEKGEILCASCKKKLAEEEKKLM